MLLSVPVCPVSTRSCSQLRPAAAWETCSLRGRLHHVTHDNLRVMSPMTTYMSSHRQQCQPMTLYILCHIFIWPFYGDTINSSLSSVPNLSRVRPRVLVYGLISLVHSLIVLVYVRPCVPNVRPSFPGECMASCP